VVQGIPEAAPGDVYDLSMRRWVTIAAVGAGAILIGVGAAVVLVGGDPERGGAVATTASPGGNPSKRPAKAAPQPLGGPTSDPVPILMYHVIADPPAAAPYPELYVSGPAFAAQMRWLARHGFHAVTLHAVADHWRLGRRLPAHPIVVSFDDGYRSQFATAAPALRRHGWPGVINLAVRNTTDFWGLPPAQVRLLIADGWEVAAHSLTHPDLTKIGAEQLRHEVAGSRAALRKMFHVPVDFFCYPAGRLDGRVVAAVQAAGYVGATTTAPGIARPTDMFRLARVRVNRSDGVTGLAARLRAVGVTS
jgi:peptidoglycan/xylan/chitin deacetylase (PgdA/CDA1 family)